MDLVPTFDDLLTMRKGGPDMTMGRGPTRVERIATPGEWAEKAEIPQAFGCQAGNRTWRVLRLEPKILLGERTQLMDSKRFSQFHLIPSNIKAFN